jgi:hypothetical protein
MPDSLLVLEAQRQQVLQQIAELGDFRSGSINAAVTRCGKPTCHCARAKDPGHRASPRLTYKVEGTTVTETFPSEAAQRKVQREIDAFHRWQELSRKLVEVSAAICRLRPVSESATAPTEQEKKRWKRSSKKSAGRSARS